MANFLRTRIGGGADFIEAVFKYRAIFNGAQIEGHAFFKPATFEGEADFVSARIGGNAEFHKAVFGDQSIFNGAQIEGAAFFKSVTFQGEANFVRTRIGGNAEYTEAVFKGQAIFNSAQIEEDAFFNPATFEGKADFAKAWIGGDTGFTKAVFKDRASFNGAQIEGSAFFNTATFEGEANFVSARIGSTAEFTKAVFKDRVSFNRSQIEEAAFFDPATFEGEANFASARIGGNADFTKAVFKDRASFRGARIGMDTFFHGAKFAKDVSFLNASVTTVFWGHPETRFQGKVDLRGCIYARISPTSIWEKLMDRLGPYDRQPFSQLEETFRQAGEGRLANDVYYNRRRRESALIPKRNIAALIGDLFLRGLTGYGVRLYRLLIAIALVLVVGTFFFQNEGAVDPLKETLLSPAVESQVNTDVRPSLIWREAFWVSLNLFLPIDIPAGGEWKPSSQIIWGISSTTFAILLTLSGWILIPVGVAGISGMLKR